MTIKHPSPTAVKGLATARKRAKDIQKKLRHLPKPADLLSVQEMEDAAPFYFELRNYIQQLKEAREQQGLTLSEVAAKSGLAIESLSRLETGAQNNPTWKSLGAYALALGRRPILSADAFDEA